MNKEKLLSRAWKITWNNKYLWLFGFIAALTLGQGNNQNFLLQGASWILMYFGNILNSGTIPPIFLLGVALIFGIGGMIARSSLIYEISTLNNERKQSPHQIGELLKIGWQRLPRIIAMQLIVWSPILTLAVIAFFIAQPMMGTLTSSTGSLNPQLGSRITTLSMLAMLNTLIAIPLLFIEAFTYRVLVLEEHTVISGLQYAGKIIQENIKSLLSLILVYGVLIIIITLIIGIIISTLSALLTPMLSSIMLQNIDQCSEYFNNITAFQTCLLESANTPSYIAVALVSSVIGAGLSSILVTFQSGVFTLVYDHFTHKRRVI